MMGDGGMSLTLGVLNREAVRVLRIELPGRPCSVADKHVSQYVDTVFAKGRGGVVRELNMALHDFSLRFIIPAIRMLADQIPLSCEFLEPPPPSGCASEANEFEGAWVRSYFVDAGEGRVALRNEVLYRPPDVREARPEERFVLSAPVEV